MRLGKGNDTVHVGTGVSHVATGGGETVFIPAYGGVTLVDKWAAGQVYDFSQWPAAPHITRHGDVVEFTLGLSVLRVLGVEAGADVAGQIRWGAAAGP
ncbi:MAG: hypothetical protein U5N55_05875 [Cypionkella sp.]|nr:hypothetical protein [Cypionkella sp.]